MSITSTGRHQAEHENWWARRSKKGKLGILTLALFLIAGVAIAAFLVLKGVTGSVSGAVLEIHAQAVEAPTGNANCAVTLSGPGANPAIAWTNAVASDSCHFAVRYEASPSNTGNLRLQRFVAPSGVVATFGDAAQCGFVVAPGAQVTTDVDLAYDGTVATATFAPATHGVEFVRAVEFDPLLCNPIS